MVTDERRNTAQRELVTRALADADGFLSAGELHQRILAGGAKIGLATVYRQLNAMAEHDEIDVVAVSNERMFRACAPDEHHHHLVCERCGRAVDLPPPEESWITSAARSHDFAVTRHVLEVFGICASCREAR